MKRLKQKKRRARIITGLVSILALEIVAVAGFLILRNVRDDNVIEEDNRVVEEIKEQVIITPPPQPTQPPEEEPHENTIDENLLRRVDFDTLQERNADAQRWIYIPDTNIDYYVMQEPEFKSDGSYMYLHRDIDKNWSSWGSILTVKGPNDNIEDAHLLVFGHHMMDKTVAFSNLHNYYATEEDADSHKYIYMYYPNHSERWVVWTVVEGLSSDAVYEIPYELGTSAYEELIEDIDSKGLYDRVDKPSNNTKTLVLSTCNGRVGGTPYRFYVVAVPEARYYYEIETLVKGDYYEHENEHN